MIFLPSSSSSFMWSLPQMSTLSVSPSYFILHRISRFRPNCRAMTTLPKSISAFPSKSSRSTRCYPYLQAVISSSSPFSRLSVYPAKFSPGMKLSGMKQGGMCRTRLLRGAAAGLFGSFVNAKSASADATMCGDGGDDNDDDGTTVSSSHGKKGFTDYTIRGMFFDGRSSSLAKFVLSRYDLPAGIHGDGRCLFRSVAHGACVRSGKPAPDETLQRELADELRSKVADEFVKRREETEWFIEGDFDSYVAQIRRPHVWGGEPEILMATHVLGMPITVYMHDEDAGGLIAIAEYGQEYGKDNPIRVLYHGYGHYEALQIPSSGARMSRL